MRRDQFIEIPELTQERAKMLYDYDPQSGVFRVRFSRGGLLIGSEAGTVGKSGHVALVIEGRRILAHRLAWLYVYGVWPTGSVDHINGTPGDNRIVNLRDVSHATNQQNRRRPTKANTSGYLGVTPHQGKYVAGLTINGRRKYLGIFDDPRTAYLAYVEAKRALHQGCTL